MQEKITEPFVSIIICTYNPKKEIFSKVLDGILDLSGSNGLSEIIIIDNNSKTQLEEIDYIADFKKNALTEVKIIREIKSGLTNARIRGFKESKGKFLLFVDDDNILSKNYVNEIVGLVNQYPNVHCWGPGNVKVQFSGPVEDWVETRKWIFQEKRNDYVKYGLLRGWHSYSPAGTGLIVERSIMDDYTQRVESGTMNATDRTGKSLTSGGDSQIIHTATLNGKAVGMAPELSLIHYISAEKVTLKYVKELLFMVNSSIHVHYEVFNDIKNQLLHIPSTSGFILFLFSTLRKSKLRVKSPDFVIPVAAELGLIEGSYKILKIKKIPVLFRFAKRLVRLN